MNFKRNAGAVILATSLVAALLVVTSGCESTKDAAKPDMEETGKGGAQLWGENCANCHNSRSPAIYSDANWDVSVQHMRVRANLTGDEERKIVAFLKAGN